MHSSVEMVDLADVEGAIQLLVAFIRRLDGSESFIR
jgi:putative aminopeptidase FrvX